MWDPVKKVAIVAEIRVEMTECIFEFVDLFS